jgi:hypothetical protein
MNREAPKIAQFTAIKGRKIPSEAYRAGAYLSKAISTTCTLAAIVPIKERKVKKERSASAKLGFNHTSAPSLRTKL